MSYDLTVLPNGLMICKVTLKNPKNSISITCNALIDTGAEITVMCQSIFDKLSFDEDEVTLMGFSSVDMAVHVPAVNLDMKFPHDNWSEYRIGVYVKDLTHRVEYDVIIGVNMIGNFQLVYNRIQEKAWLDD